MVRLTLEIDETLMARLRAKAQAEDAAVETIAIAALQTTVDEAAPHNLLSMLSDLSETFEPLSDRSDIAENFDSVMDEWAAEDLARQQKAAPDDDADSAG